MAINAGKHGDNPARGKTGAHRRQSREAETMLDEKTTAMIHEKAEEIMAQIQGGKIYGEPVNLLDPDQILLAAYIAGETAADRERSFPPQYILHDPY
jgi:hypothetical protein